MGQVTYRWTVSHTHRVEVVDGVRRLHDCSDHVRLGRDGAPGRLNVVFAEGPGRVVSGGGYTHAGAVSRDGDYLNLNRPGVVRAVLDEALHRGWQPEQHAELDGWAMYDGVLTRLRAAEPAAESG
ncbi:hypothetical protein GCM10009679_31520 [Saccharothrix algeriensis]|uniref:Uncharacterized protein n=1 Tax=Catellatospora bangladeshensis TaxID=310355 RepID=A0A8J3JI61_9ACTN|nr:hypothetical protein Cba03nite_43880 [Catellatospora bangladeshensis]